MKKLAIAFVVGAAALLGGSAANAADNTVKAKAATDVTQQSTDLSSRGRHYRHYGYSHYGYRHYRPYYGTATATLRVRTMAVMGPTRLWLWRSERNVWLRRRWIPRLVIQKSPQQCGLFLYNIASCSCFSL